MEPRGGGGGGGSQGVGPQVGALDPTLLMGPRGLALVGEAQWGGAGSRCGGPRWDGHNGLCPTGIGTRSRPQGISGWTPGVSPRG